MREQEQKYFLDMIRRNEFIEVQGREEENEDKANLNFMMIDNNPIIIK